MTRVITVALIALALYAGWSLVKYAEKYDDSKNQKVPVQAPPAPAVTPEQLPGLPPQLQPSLAAACSQGGAAMRNWLRAHGQAVKDPRKAWIELDYCRMIVRDDPNEAKRIFAAVKQRTPVSSPVWPRIQELKSTFE